MTGKVVTERERNLNEVPPEHETRRALLWMVRGKKEISN